MIVKTIVILSVLFSLIATGIFGQDVCMYDSKGQKVCYEVSATRILVKIDTLNINANDIENVLRNPVVGSLKNVYDDWGDLLVIEMQNTSTADMWALQRQLSSIEDIIYTSPVFGDASVYTNKIIVRLKAQSDYPVLLKVADDYQIKDIEEPGPYSPWYLLTLPHNPEKDAMQTALELYETGLFLAAYPDFIILCPFEWCPFEPEQSGGNMNDVQDERKIVLYPNPVNDVLYVDLGNETAGSCDIRLYNSLGNLCRQAKSANETVVEFNVSNLSGGIYFLIISNSDASKAETHKIIVKH